jgi:hypothetical protein
MDVLHKETKPINIYTRLQIKVAIFLILILTADNLFSGNYLSVIINIILCYFLLEEKNWAKTWTLLRSYFGIPIAFVWLNTDPLSSENLSNTIFGVGVVFIPTIILLTGKGQKWKLITAIGISAFSFVLFFIPLLMFPS